MADCRSAIGDAGAVVGAHVHRDRHRVRRRGLQRAAALRGIVRQFVGAQLNGEQIGIHGQLRLAAGEIDGRAGIDPDLRVGIARG